MAYTEEELKDIDEYIDKSKCYSKCERAMIQYHYMIEHHSKLDLMILTEYMEKIFYLECPILMRQRLLFNMSRQERR